MTRYTTASWFSRSTKANDSQPKRILLDIRPGDRILSGTYAGREIRLEGKEYVIMKEEDVLAVIEPDLPKTGSHKLY